MAQAAFSVRMDETLKKRSDITREGAMQVFMALRTQAEDNGVADMSLADINKEIDLARMEAKK